MRPVTLLSITLVILLLSITFLVSPANLLNLINLPGLLVVLGGSFLAIMLSKPQQEVMELLRELPSIYKNEAQSLVSPSDIKYLMRLAHLNRSGRLRAMEQELASIQQPLLKKGIQLILDKCSVKEISLLVSREKAKLLQSNKEKAKILRLMSSYAPAFGMLGTLLGLIHMLYNLGTVEIATVGSTMGFALLTTLYGLLAANLVFKPLAIKLERVTALHEMQLNMLAEGVLMVQEKKHPLIINDVLESYLSPVNARVVGVPKSFFSKMVPVATAHVD